jgi:replicative DNA helicase
MAADVVPLFSERAPASEGPSSIETEQAILGAIIANNKRFVQAESLRPEHFFNELNGRLFGEIARRIIAGRLADGVTLKDWLVANSYPLLSQQEASRYLTDLITAVISHDITSYVAQVKDYWTRRQILAQSRRLAEAAENLEAEIGPSVIQITDAADAVLTDQSDAIDISFSEATSRAIKRVKEAKKRGTHGGLIVPAMPKLSRRIAFLPEQLTILGGQSGEGKSAIAWQITMSIAEKMQNDIEKGRPRSEVGGIVGLSFEMSAESLANRALSAHTGIPVEVIETHILTDEQIARLEEAETYVAKLPFRVLAVGGMTPTMIRMRLRQARRKLGGHIAMVVIDHVQLVEADEQHSKGGGAWATGKVADAILYMAKEFKTHVLALSQVDIKDIAKRQEKRPTRADLRWSANFAQNADNILFIHRPEAHLPKAAPTQEQGEPEQAWQERVQAWRDLKDKYAGKAELIGDKCRQGAGAWVIPLFFNGPTTSFSEVPESYGQ